MEAELGSYGAGSSANNRVRERKEEREVTAKVSPWSVRAMTAGMNEDDDEDAVVFLPVQQIQAELQHRQRERRKRDCAHLPPPPPPYTSCKLQHSEPAVAARESVGVIILDQSGREPVAHPVPPPPQQPQQHAQVEAEAEATQGSVVTNDELFDPAAFIDTDILLQQDINMIEKIAVKKEIQPIPPPSFPSLFAREEPTLQQLNGMMALNGANMLKTHVVPGSNNIIEDRVERHRAKHRISNMSTEQIERQRNRNRVANMTLDQIEKQRARNRIENMTPEKIERQRARNRVANMTAEQIERQRARNRIKNMTPEKIEKQRVRNRKSSAKLTPAALLSTNQASADDSLTTLQAEQGFGLGPGGGQQEGASIVSVSSLSQSS